jgi:hypothetical protein
MPTSEGPCSTNCEGPTTAIENVPLERFRNVPQARCGRTANRYRLFAEPMTAALPRSSKVQIPDSRDIHAVWNGARPSLHIGEANRIFPDSYKSFASSSGMCSPMRILGSNSIHVFFGKEQITKTWDYSGHAK